MQNSGGAVMRQGFSLIMALFFLMILGSLGLFSVAYSAISNKETGNLYLNEQAKLLAESSVEYTVAAIQSHNFDKNCLKKVSIAYPKSGNDALFNITNTIYYIGRKGKINCDNWLNNTKPSDITSPAQINAVVIDTVVESTQKASTEKIRYFRRTTQKP